ncbi:hypothetical protein AX16_004943 [Volvariella volvacea WC 439]|nr:hypothetical protein AX16_004943 [Volvariella volvacea WC 439]
MPKNVVIVGGHGKVALRLTKLLIGPHNVTSIIRNAEQVQEIAAAGAIPLLLSLEDSPTSAFTQAFQGKDVVYFSAGAGGRGGEERTKTVDYEGALKVFDAIEAVEGEKKPRLIMVSAIDIRDPEKIPEHYNEGDIAMSKRIRSVIPAYMHWKYEADKNLIKRTAFKWTILRPGGLRDTPGTGVVALGRTHITETVSRDDVAKVLALLLDREDASGLAIDLAGGSDDIAERLEAFIEKGETDFPLDA